MDAARVTTGAGGRRPSRRSVLRGGATGGVLVAAGLVLPLTSCARTPEGPDELEAPLAAARSDAALATAAGGAFPELAARLTPVAEARRAHAEALAAEVRRARPDRVEAVDAPASTPPPAPPSAAAALTALRGALGTASTDGRTLALRAEPYRCGLLASVAAGCAGHETALA